MQSHLSKAIVLTCLFLFVVLSVTLLNSAVAAQARYNLVLVRQLSTLNVPDSNIWFSLAQGSGCCGHGDEDDELARIARDRRRFGTVSWLLALRAGCAAIPDEQLSPNTYSELRLVDLFHAGICLSLLDRHVEATQMWRAMRQPDLAERILYTSQRLAERCCPEVARHLVESASQFGYESAEAYFQLGHYHRYRGEADLAIRAYTQAALRAAHEPRYSYAAGMYLYQLGRSGDAIYWLERVVQLQPRNPEVMLLLAHAYREAGMLDKATEWYRATIALDSIRSEPVFGLASVEWKRGKWQEAIHYARAAAALSPDNQNAQLELASYLIRVGELDEAERLCWSALAKQSNLPTAYFLLGLIAEARGRWAEAESFYEQVLRLDPHRTTAKERLMGVREILQNQGQP